MSRPLAVALALFGSTLSAAPAAAQDVLGLYAQVHGGVFAQTGDRLSVAAIGAADDPIGYAIDTDPDIGWSAGGLVGYSLGLGLAVEGEVTFRSNDFSTGGAALPSILPGPSEVTAETATFMVNGVYQFTVPLVVAPYVGAGVGYLRPGGDVDAFDGGFAYQAKAGLAWPVGVGRVLTEVTYLGTNDLETGNDFAALDYGGVAGQVGYRFGF